MSRFSSISSQPAAVVAAGALAIATIAVLGLVPHAAGVGAVLADVLLCAEFAACMTMFARARTTSRGTRRALFTALALASAFAIIGRAAWTIVYVATGHAPQPPYVEAVTGIALQLSAMVGFAMALTRYRHQNWMRFEAMVDALLLIAAAAIVISQISAFPSAATSAGAAMRLVALGWNVLGVANLILIVLVLVWRGEVLGTRLAFGLTAGAVALGLANYIYGRVVLLAGGAFPTSTGILWSLAILFVAATIYEPRRNAGAGQDSIESPTYESDSARVRTFSIVVAILIATLSASMLAFRRGHSVALGVALAAFGVLLAMRAGHALFTQQRTTMVLEHVAIAEREIASMLEQRVDARTEEFAEAHRVLQRMWTLGQQIALELTPERVLQRFIEASVDVLRADGAAIGLMTDDRIQVAITTGLDGAPSIAGRSFAVSGSAIGRVVRTAESVDRRRAAHAGLGRGRACRRGARPRGDSAAPPRRVHWRDDARVARVAHVLGTRDRARRSHGGPAVGRARERGAGRDAAQDRVALPHALPRGAGRGAHGARERPDSRGERRGAGSRRLAAGAARWSNAGGIRARVRVERFRPNSRMCSAAGRRVSRCTCATRRACASSRSPRACCPRRIHQ